MRKASMRAFKMNLKTVTAHSEQGKPHFLLKDRRTCQCSEVTGLTPQLRQDVLLPLKVFFFSLVQRFILVNLTYTQCSLVKNKNHVKQHGGGDTHKRRGFLTSQGSASQDCEQHTI